MAAVAAVAAYWLLEHLGLLFAALLVWLLASVACQAVLAVASRRVARTSGPAWSFRSVSAAYFLLLAAAAWIATVHIQLDPSELRAARFELLAVVAIALLATWLERPAHAWPVRLSSRTALAVLLAVELLRVHSPPDPVVELALPFESALVVQGGEGDLVNHHFSVPSQRYAVDLVLPEHVDATKSRSLQDYPCYGTAVLAGAAGTILHAVGDRPDESIGSSDLSYPFGNHVVLALDEAAYYAVYAHLARGSVTVLKGQRVRRGERIGACGNSGNTSEPHLHLQVHAKPFATVDDPSARAVPFAFDAVANRNHTRLARIPRRNDHLRRRGEHRAVEMGRASGGSESASRTSR